VVSRPGRKLKHGYTLTNPTDSPIHVLQVVNRKTCCGEVQINTTTLPPGGSSVVTVMLLVGTRFDEVVHETEVITDHPGDDSFVLRTSARAIAALRLTPADGGGVARVDRGQDAGGEFNVLAAGTEADPPVDLDQLTLRSTLKTAWTGPAESVPDEEGLTALRRRFRVLYDSSTAPGEHQAEVEIRDTETPLLKEIVRWEVLPTITVSPSVLVLRADRPSPRVVLSSRGQTFTIRRIECENLGLKGHAEGTAPARTQVVRFEGLPVSPKGGRGTVSLFTDHPGQDRVDLPFVVIE
jgi:hypothetical protein